MLTLRDNQKLENLPNSLQSLTLGEDFNHKLNACLALPNLKILKISDNYEGNVPIIFETIIIITCYNGIIRKKIKNQVKQNYDFSEWKNIFHKSVKDLL